MAFPRDIQEGNRYVARFHEDVLAQLEAMVKKEPALQAYPVSRMVGEFFGSLLEPLGGFSILHNAPGYSDMLERLWSRTWPGAIAGDLLLNLLQLRGAGLDASVNKALAIELEYLSEATDGAGRPGPGRSERYIREAWEEFKPACHLWAAYRVWDFSGRPDSFAPYLDESIEAFLAVSRAYALLAVGLQPQGRRRPLLNAKEMWLVSRRYELPPVQLKIPPLEDWKVQALLRKFKSLRP